VAELQKDPITRGDFLSFGVLGAITGAILTIPPAAFILAPIIDVDVLGKTDVADDWQEVASVSEVPEKEPKAFEVEFPIRQTYGDERIQEESGVGSNEFTLKNAVWLSWKAQIGPDGHIQKVNRPSILEQKTEGFTQSEREELMSKLNVLSNSCAHLGCPVRWLVTEGVGEFLCPCHGGIYDINGDYIAGPPPRGMYRYNQTEVREDGKLYIKHGYDVGGEKGPQQPYVV
jgi:Rieske Fe-S protein